MYRGANARKYVVGKSYSRSGKLQNRLPLSIAFKYPDHALQRVRHTGRVQRRQHQVTRLGGGQRRGNGLVIAHLTHNDDVRILAQHVNARLKERTSLSTSC